MATGELYHGGLLFKLYLTIVPRTNHPSGYSRENAGTSKAHAQIDILYCFDHGVVQIGASNNWTGRRQVNTTVI